MLKNATFLPQESQALERIVSLKAGTVGAVGCAAVAGLIGMLPNLGIPIPSPTNLFITVAIAWISGFLFGVTYRYAIRSDRNPQLKAGTVMAFGLVRGLALSEFMLSKTSLTLSNLMSLDFLLPMGIVLGESVAWFVVPQLALDFFIAKGWLTYSSDRELAE